MVEFVGVKEPSELGEGCYAGIYSIRLSLLVSGRQDEQTSELIKHHPGVLHDSEPASELWMSCVKIDGSQRVEGGHGR